jgi:hypothetical protein
MESAGFAGLLTAQDSTVEKEVGNAYGKGNGSQERNQEAEKEEGLSKVRF